MLHPKFVFMNPTSVEVSIEIARFLSFFFSLFLSSLDMIFGLVLMLLICFWIRFYHVAEIFCVVVILSCTIAILKKSGTELKLNLKKKKKTKHTMLKQCWTSDLNSLGQGRGGHGRGIYCSIRCFVLEEPSEEVVGR